MGISACRCILYALDFPEQVPTAQVCVQGRISCRHAIR